MLVLMRSQDTFRIQKQAKLGEVLSCSSGEREKCWMLKCGLKDDDTRLKSSALDVRTSGLDAWFSWRV